MAAESTLEDKLRAWLSARSIVRGLPAPVADHGGYRVDTDSDTEARRWVFSRPTAGLAALGVTIQQPRHFLKLCGSADDLRGILPDRWKIQPPGYFMQAGEPAAERPVPEGYTVTIDRIGDIARVRILSADDHLAASGHAVQTRDAFLYDRIVTTPEHRRKGLGFAVMTALRRARHLPETPELLVATADGRALYASMGWRILSPYSTAVLPDA